MRIFNNFLELAWGQRFSIILLGVATVIQLRAALLKLIKTEWKWMYWYGTFTTGCIFLYAVLLLTEVLEPGEYARALQWLSPLILLRLIMAPMIHIWQEQTIRRLSGGVVGNRLSRRRNLGLHNVRRLVFHQGQGKERGKPYLGSGRPGSERDAPERGQKG